LEYWKAEALYRLLLNEKNKIKPEHMGNETRKLFSKGED
jgi:hypothetical protein